MSPEYSCNVKNSVKTVSNKIRFRTSMSTESMIASIECMLEEDNAQDWRKALQVAAARLNKLNKLVKNMGLSEEDDSDIDTEPLVRNFRDTEVRAHRHVIERYSEMLVAIDKAGGAIEFFTWKKLQEMSAASLIEKLTPNMQITFTPNPKR